jgi:hypothetical protein
MILRQLCIWLVFYSLLSSLILSNLKHELFNRLRSTIYGSECVKTIIILVFALSSFTVWVTKWAKHFSFQIYLYKTIHWLPATCFRIVFYYHTLWLTYLITWLSIIYFSKYCVTKTGKYAKTYFCSLNNPFSKCAFYQQSAFNPLNAFIRIVRFSQQVINISLKSSQLFIFIRDTYYEMILYVIQELVVLSGCISGFT